MRPNQIRMKLRIFLEQGRRELKRKVKENKEVGKASLKKTSLPKARISFISRET